MGTRKKKLSTGEKIGLGALAVVGFGVARVIANKFRGSSEGAGTPAAKDDQPPQNLTDDVLGGLIHKLVNGLDASPHGKKWGMVGLEVLEQVAVGLLPKWAGKLLHIVWQVEHEAIEEKIEKASKKAVAIMRAREQYSAQRAN